MKKVLFSTTALAAASMLAFSASDAQAGSHSKAKPLSIKVGGFMKAAVGFSEQDGSFESTNSSTARTGYDSFNQYNDSEIYFTGSTKLDNGITASVTVQLEADQVKNGTQIDASFLRLTGGFGDLRLGSGSYASAVLSNKAPWTGAMNPHGSDYSAWIVKPAANSISAVAGTSIGGGDDMKIAWISPTISGLRLGLSYEPSSAEGSDAPPAVGGNSGTDVQTYDVAINYATKVGSADVKADVAYFEKHGASTASNATWRVGGTVAVGGVTIGGSYMDVDNIDTGRGGLAGSDEEVAYDIGAMYATGPFTVSATYFHVEQPLASGTPGDDEHDKFILGMNYNMGPGVDLQGTLAYVDWEDESTADADNNDGWALVGAVQVTF
jgi:outer membrane protein OmpU